jgi:beta-1,2-mannobiose phosphorylase / 1,2-beta-oligomannan phosphorylase
MLHRPNFWTKAFQASPEAARFPTNLPCPFEELPERPSAWIAYSDDLVSWDSHALVTGLASDGNVKIGPGVPPIKTEDGWLVIYHHVRHTEGEGGLTYEARVALLDLADPRKVVAQLPYAILAPEAEYEREGLTKNVIFPTGAFIKDGTLFVYYGAADTCCGLATGDAAELIRELAANRR